MTHIHDFCAPTTARVIPPPEKGPEKVAYTEKQYAKLMMQSAVISSNDRRIKEWSLGVMGRTPNRGEHAYFKKGSDRVYNLTPRAHALIALMTKKPNQTARFYAEALGTCPRSMSEAIRRIALNGYKVDRTAERLPRYTLTKVAPND